VDESQLRAIVAKVVAELLSPAPSAPGATIVLAGGYALSLEATLAAIREGAATEPGVSIIMLPDFASRYGASVLAAAAPQARVLPMPGAASDRDRLLATHRRVMLAGFSPWQLIALSHGVAPTPELEFIFEALAAGRDVHLATVPTFSPESPAPFRRGMGSLGEKLERAIQELAAWGVVTETTPSVQASESGGEKPDSPAIRRNFLTVDDVRKASREGATRMTVSSGSTMTAAAFEEAIRLGIEIT